jgi:purine-nucleoside phosphorylase
MTPHLEAKPGDIADRVLLPGDPLRAQHIAETYLESPVCYNRVRGMLGFTGTYKGKRVSVQGTGMGVPSISIYVHELLSAYGVERVMRVGTCGSMQEHVNLRDVILAMSASTDSAINKIRFAGMDYAPTADAGLLFAAREAAGRLGLDVHAGPVLTSDTFYYDDPEAWRIWADFGVLAAEMETAALYTLAAKFKARALSVLTVSDNIVKGESTTPEERQTSFGRMMELALETI